MPLFPQRPFNIIDSRGNFIYASGLLFVQRILIQGSVTPLAFAGHAITISVHFGIGAILNEIFGLVAGSHVRAMSAPVAIELRRQELARI